MPQMGGLDLLATLKAKQHPATVIVMSAYGNVDLAIEAMKAGAYDYVSKPFKPDEIVLALRKAEERETLRRENRALREQIQQGEPVRVDPRQEPARCWTSSGPIAKIADFKTTVLITGESGDGQGARRARHPRALEPKRGALRRHQLRRDPREPPRESELFGHKRGRLHRRHVRPARPLRGGRTAGRCSSTRSASSRSPPGQAPARAPGGAHPPPRRHARTSKSTCASSPRPTATSRPT